MLKDWMFHPDNVSNPYPSNTQKEGLMRETGLSKRQIDTWFVNARKRFWAPKYGPTPKAMAKSNTGGSTAAKNEGSEVAPRRSARKEEENAGMNAGKAAAAAWLPWQRLPPPRQVPRRHQSRQVRPARLAGPRRTVPTRPARPRAQRRR